EAADEVEAVPLGGLDQVPRLARLNRDRLLDEHMRACLERRLRVLVVEGRRTRDEADVDPGVDHVVVVLARELEAPIVPDLHEELRALACDADELDLVAAPREVRQVRGDRPRPCPDHPEAKLLRHAYSFPALTCATAGRRPAPPSSGSAAGGDPRSRGRP